MAPRTISFPPVNPVRYPKTAGGTPIDYCLAYSDVLEIDFHADGQFKISEAKAFNKGLLKGHPKNKHHKDKQKVKGLHPDKKHDHVDLSFVADKDGKTYVYKVTFQQICPNACNS